MKLTTGTVAIALTALSLSQPWAADPVLYERIELSATDRERVQALASNLVGTSRIAKVDAFGLVDAIHHVTITFAPDQQKQEFTVFRSVDCYRADREWECEAPQRVLRLANECPPAEITLDAGLSVSVAKQIYEYVKTEQQPRFRTVTRIVAAELGQYDVHITYVDGFGIWRIKGEEQWFPGK